MAIISDFEEFRIFCTKGSKILAIDHGTKKVGTAISSPDLSISFPFKTIFYASEKKLLSQILEMIELKQISAIIIGLPLNMDGSKSDQTIIVEKFCQKLSNRTNLPIYMQDERLTSKMANHFLRAFGLSRKERNEQDDNVAANMILETVLQLLIKN